MYPMNFIKLTYRRWILITHRARSRTDALELKVTFSNELSTLTGVRPLPIVRSTSSVESLTAQAVSED